MLRKNSGFTLVELLIVVAIIGILAAIAIPQFAAYRAKAYCSAVKSDLANMAIAQEAFFTDNNAYTSSAALIAAGTITASTGVAITADNAVGTTNGFTVSMQHTNCLQGSGGAVNGTYQWDSTKGGLQP
jgi:prepilin-type N-terminal cleavage/methylation domain-containing protein